MTAYIREAYERKIGDRVIFVTNLNQKFSADEKRKVKLQIEEKLYDVFSKYMSLKP